MPLQRIASTRIILPARPPALRPARLVFNLIIWDDIAATQSRLCSCNAIEAGYPE
jgi:hypothetical protein